MSYSSIPVYRFFDSHNGTHFYTTSADERSTILQTRPDLIPEGPGGVGLRAVDPTSGDPNAVQVFRFFDTVHGTQFLTASTTERDTLVATRSDLTYEPNSLFYEQYPATGRGYRGLPVFQQHRRHPLLYRQRHRTGGDHPDQT